jgi:hypothetical protein
MNYVCENPIEDEIFNNLVNLIWQILSINAENFHDAGVSERNLVILL